MGKFGLKKWETYLYHNVQSIFQYREMLNCFGITWVWQTGRLANSTCRASLRCAAKNAVCAQLYTISNKISQTQMYYNVLQYLCHTIFIDSFSIPSFQMTESPSWKWLRFAAGATEQLTAALKSGTAVSLRDECTKECNNTCFCCASIWYRMMTESSGDDGCALMTTSLITSSAEWYELDCTPVCWNKPLRQLTQYYWTLRNNTFT